LKKILYIKLLALVLLLSTPFSVLSQDNEPDIKEQADKFFNKENYVEATPLYLRLIALNPKSYEYNYKYGTCILYNSHKKTDAFKYLNFAVTGPDVSPDAFYYLGKAFELQEGKMLVAVEVKQNN
jgi:predicted Zn-dependent protease